jgi:undecaprenyl-diphosphatase
VSPPNPYTGETKDLFDWSIARNSGVHELSDLAWVEGKPGNFDQSLLLLFRDPADPAVPLGPEWVQYFMINMTALGSTPVLLLVTVLTAGFFLVVRKRRSAVLLTFAFVGGALLSSGLKQLFLRARPDLVTHLVDVDSASFPSGHAMKSAVVYRTLAVMLARAQLTRASRTYLLVAAAGITVLVGLSRVYLGVHWPTDVIAGWFVGALWAVACICVADRLHPKRTGPGD